MSRARPNNMEQPTAEFALEHEPARASRTDKGVGSGPWLAALREFEKLVYDRHDDFLDRFARGPAFELTQLAVDSENVRLVYILDSGQHIADSVKLADVLQWLSANNRDEPTPVSGCQPKEKQ